MSPVTRKNAEGLPLFYLRDIPPVAVGGPEVREPRIYFGEETDTYVIVKSSTPEFDYPKGKENSYANYDGSARNSRRRRPAATALWLVFQ